MIYTDEYGIYARLPVWGYGTRPSAMAGANMPATRMAMASARSTSIPWRCAVVAQIRSMNHDLEVRSSSGSWVLCAPA